MLHIKADGDVYKRQMQTIQILNNKNKEAIDVLVHNVSLQSGEMGCEVTCLLYTSAPTEPAKVRL